MRNFTVMQLSTFNGINKPAYVGYQGKVYDVSTIFKGGEHAGIKAGQDLTDDFAKGPHQADIFNNFPVVGALTEESLCGKVFSGTSIKTDLLLRLALGTVFFAHGAQKLLGWFGGYGWSGTMGYLTQTVHLASPIAGLVILLEFFAGIAIILGFLTRPAALGIALVMLGAAFTVHLPNGFFLDKGGVEYVFVLFLVALFLLINGAGTISIDRLIRTRFQRN
ncbi:DoxX family membrane protein [Desulfosporosinus metallidurans]|uniref:Membrane protein, distant similarity to thiosulfate:quinone oxidoreductase DoxD n=1 Tax=Desulfosporosinus metallidurans TaxID=1888891 RepID=A0A1Q8QIB2_9FIRM|nr:DoxX family membrane protein [Desulfosporosinus metallidurans]OLN27056.1 Membrane protein, distant similarity to thiosulfate:quinone oxidoreductase DoxD [Desulfosporosinus metallidurans]